MITQLLIFTGCVVAGAAANLFERQTWRNVGAELGLYVSLGTILIGVNRLSGRLRDFEVAIFPHEKVIGIDVFPVDPGFTLGRDGAVSQMIKTDIETGLPSFDDKVRIEGDASYALALLGQEARRVALGLVEMGATVAERRIRCKVPRLKNAAPVLEQMLDLAEALRRPAPEKIPALLSRRALEEPFTGIRLQAFRKLASSYYRSDELLETARALADTWEASLKLEACRVLLRERVSLHGGAEGRADGLRAAEELMKLATTAQAKASLRGAALELVARSAFREAHVPAMAELLSQAGAEPPEVRHAALEGLVQARAKDELLALELPADPAEAEILAYGLARIRCVAGQPRLLELLEHAEEDVKKAAALALGAVGDLAAVGPLRQLTTSGSLFPSSLARAAESSILLIQERAGGSQAGEISLVAVEPLEGAVSPANDSARVEVEGDEVGNEIGGEVSLV